MLSNKLTIILQDTKGFINYRNRIYSQSEIWPESRTRQLKITLYLFKHNINGFRDLVYYRLGNSRIIRYLKRIFKSTPNLVLDIGQIAEGGCMFHHPFSTYINAESVGYQCSFRNNITIGNKIQDGQIVRPIIEDNVFVGPNSVIIGGIRIGRNAIIGAGAVVTKDVPANSIVAGNPAKIIGYQEQH